MQGILQSPGEMGVPDRGHMEAWHLPGCGKDSGTPNVLSRLL